MDNISKQECVLCPALGFSPNSHCRKLTYFLQMSFTYQSSHAGRWIGGNANFPHSGSFYKLLQKFTIDALLDKDSAGTEADFTLPRMTMRTMTRHTPSWVGHPASLITYLPGARHWFRPWETLINKTNSHHQEHTLLWGSQTTAQVNESIYNTISGHE